MSGSSADILDVDAFRADKERTVVIRRKIVLAAWIVLAALVMEFGISMPVYAAKWNTRKITLKIDKNTGGMTAKERTIYKKLYTQKSVYPEGTSWDIHRSYQYKGGYIGTAWGCSAFALYMHDYAFGTTPAVRHTRFNDLKVGDVVRMDYNSHSVVVMKVVGNKIVIVEGAYGSGIVHWGRVIQRSEIIKTGTYVLTRY